MGGEKRMGAQRCLQPKVNEVKFKQTEERGANSSSSEIIPLTLYNYIVQPDVKRCQKSREANPVLMNENRWVRQ